MVRKKIPYLMSLVLLVLFCFSVQASAAKDYLVDQANTFSAEQAALLEAQTQQLSEQYAMDIVIVTTNDTGGKTAMAYADDFFDYNGYGTGENYDGILFLMDFDNREAYISTSGSGIQYLTDARIDNILDDVFNSGMTSGDYYGAAQAFLNSTAGYLAQGIPHNTLTTVEVIIGSLASGGLGLGFFAGTKRSYKGKTQRGVFNYRNNSIVNLGVISDNMFNSFVTSRIIPRNTTSSGSSFGGSSTHTSSSGRTHGGGGRKF
jgi:uncharacterized protein